MPVNASEKQNDLRVSYTDSLENISAKNLQGFFVGWLNPPSPQIHLELLKNSDELILAIDLDTRHVIGFITAITDKILSAYIPFLEVLPEHQSRGVGQELTRRMLEKLKGLYVIDLLCDRELQPFYVRMGMKPAHGMMLRNYERQSGER
jgi:ribosomal protein S18 acetylase RimI-like enzyme